MKMNPEELELITQEQDESGRETLPGVRRGCWILPEPREAAASPSPAVKPYSKTARQDNSSFSTSCQIGLRAVCSMQKMDQQYPEDRDTNSPFIIILWLARPIHQSVNPNKTSA